MLFGRRHQESLLKRVRVILLPRHSLARSIGYFTKRVLRLRASPHAVAAGFAAGVFASFLPLLGFHFLLAALAAWLVGGNVLASALGTAVGNPLTFPLIWGATYEVGRLILDGRQMSGDLRPNLFSVLRHWDLAQFWEPLVKPMVVGSIPLGLAAAAIFYVVIRGGVSAFHRRRQARVQRRGRAGNDASFDPTLPTSSG